MSEINIPYINKVSNQNSRLLYCDDSGELANIELNNLDQVYAINDNQLYQFLSENKQQTFSGAGITFDGDDTTTFNELKLFITGSQDGSGDASSNNIRHINSYLNIGILNKGKNLLDYTNIKSLSNSTATPLDSINGFRIASNTDGTYRGGEITEISFTDGVTYTLSLDVTFNSGDIFLFGCRRKSDGGFVSYKNCYSDGHYSVTFTYSKNVPIKLTFFCTKTSGSGDVTLSNVQLEVGSTGTKFVPFIKNENLFIENQYNPYTRWINTNGVWAENASSLSYAFKCKPLTSYIIKVLDPSITVFRTGTLQKELEDISSSETLQNVTRLSTRSIVQLNTSENDKYIIIQVNKNLIDIQESTIVIEYFPNNQYEFLNTINGDIYEGELNLLTGQLVINKICKILVGNENFGLNTSATNRRFTGNMVSGTNWGWPLHKKETKVISSHFINVDNTTGNPWGCIRISNDDYVIIYDLNSVMASASTLKAWIQEQYNNGTPVQIAYELATPYIIQLTSPQIQIIADINNISTDCGVVKATITTPGFKIIEISPKN